MKRLIAGGDTGGLEEREQVGHGLLVNLLFETLRHERFAGASQFVDIRPQDGLRFVFLAFQCHASRGLRGDQARENTAVCINDHVIHVTRQQVLVGRENVGEQCLCVARGRRGEIWSERMACRPNAMAARTLIAEDLVARREQYGFSYIIVGSDDIQDFAPVVAELAGK